MSVLTANARRDLSSARQSIGVLNREKQALADQTSRALAAAENRFEGIALTGRRVVFLVDMSGSMELVDEKTPAQRSPLRGQAASQICLLLSQRKTNCVRPGDFQPSAFGPAAARWLVGRG